LLHTGNTARKSGPGVTALFLFGYSSTFVVDDGIGFHGLYLKSISAGFLRYLSGKISSVATP
jgi:hypothetical protein